MLYPLGSPLFTAWNSNGQPLSGGKLYCYEAGTTTAKATYADASGNSANPHPVALNARGEAPVFFAGVSKFVLKDASDVEIWSADYVGGNGQAEVSSMDGLRALGVPAGLSTVNLVGYAAAGDGGGGVFYWDGASTAADNGGTTILPTGHTGSGRWIRQTDGAINAMAFGSLANAVTGLGATQATLVIDRNHAFGANLTVPGNLTLQITDGGRLDVATGVTVTVNGPLLAGPYQLFAGAGVVKLGDGSVATAYGEWWGAKAGDSTVASNAAFTALIDAIYDGSNYTAEVQLLSGVYYFKDMVLKPESFKCPNIRGMGPTLTTIDLSGAAAGVPAFKIKGGSGTLAGAVVSGIRFDGNANCYGVMVADQGGVEIRDCHFGTLAQGLHLLNESTGGFTEFVTAERCRFESGCGNAMTYNRSGGNDSFHGSGLAECIVNTAAGKNGVVINTNCRPYHAPLSFTSFPEGVDPVILNNGTPSISFYGSIRLEPSAANTVMSGGSELWFAGEVITFKEDVSLGVIRLCDRIQHNSDGSATAQQRPYSLQKNPVLDGDTLATVNSMAIVTVHVQASNYDYRYVLAVDHEGYGGAGSVVTLATLRSLNTAGYGAPTFSMDANGNLKVANANYTSANNVGCKVKVTQISDRNAGTSGVSVLKQ